MSKPKTAGKAPEAPETTKAPETPAPPAPPAKTYTKEQLVGSGRFSRFRDLLAALLVDGKRYTITEAEAVINNYLKGEVK